MKKKDSSVDNYILYVFNETSNSAINSSSQLNQTQWIPLIGKFSFYR